jgi:hypothetical protein
MNVLQVLEWVDSYFLLVGVIGPFLRDCRLQDGGPCKKDIVLQNLLRVTSYSPLLTVNYKLSKYIRLHYY